MGWQCPSHSAVPWQCRLYNIYRVEPVSGAVYHVQDANVRGKP